MNAKHAQKISTKYKIRILWWGRDRQVGSIADSWDETLCESVCTRDGLSLIRRGFYLSFFFPNINSFWKQMVYKTYPQLKVVIRYLQWNGCCRVTKFKQRSFLKFQYFKFEICEKWMCCNIWVHWVNFRIVHFPVFDKMSQKWIDK